MTMIFVPPLLLLMMMIGDNGNCAAVYDENVPRCPSGRLPNDEAPCQIFWFG